MLAGLVTPLLLALYSYAYALNQISHLEDWTTIPKFDILLENKPDSTHSDSESSLPVLQYNLISENGTTYNCSFPDVVAASKQSEHDLENLKALSPEQIRAKMEITFEMAAREKCVRKFEGFWTFEICPFKEVRQMHTDGDQDLMSFSLGKFHRSYWDEKHGFVQEFQHGTDGRSCSAMFSCGQRSNDKKPLSFIEAREPTPLHYEIKVETPTLCSREQNSSEPFTLLYPMSSKCIFLNKNWWSYEFCHLAYVRQFHTERVKIEPKEDEKSSVARIETITTASFMLGRFSSGNASDPDYVNNRTSLVVGDSPYFSQTFSDGSACDLTGMRRETEVRFLCNRNVDSAKFASVKEIKTCSYLVEIETSTICTHPKFAKKDPDIFTIKCSVYDKKNKRSSNTELAEQEIRTDDPLVEVKAVSTGKNSDKESYPAVTENFEKESNHAVQIRETSDKGNDAVQTEEKTDKDIKDAKPTKESSDQQVNLLDRDTHFDESEQNEISITIREEL